MFQFYYLQLKELENYARQLADENKELQAVKNKTQQALLEQTKKEAEKEVGAPIEISGFKRFNLGEGVEKKEEDFADEVAKVANG